MRWERVPESLLYLRSAVEICAPFRIHRAGEGTVEDRLTESDFRVLVDAKRELTRRGDYARLVAWLEGAEKGRPSEKEAAWDVRALLMTLEKIGLIATEPEEELTRGVLSNLPLPLEYLGEAALRMKIEMDCQALAFLEDATEQDLEFLASIAEKCRLNDHYSLVNIFLDEFPLDCHRESAALYFLFLTLDYADFEFE